MTRCSGCEHDLQYHVHNVLGNTLCLVLEHGFSSTVRCDCVNGISPYMDRQRKRDEKQRKETETFIDKIVNIASNKFKENTDEEQLL
jgi:hypothetical protein